MEHVEGQISAEPGTPVDLASAGGEHSEHGEHKNDAKDYFFGEERIEGPEDSALIERLTDIGPDDPGDPL
jgi:hypothetical protein